MPKGKLNLKRATAKTKMELAESERLNIENAKKHEQIANKTLEKLNAPWYKNTGYVLILINIAATLLLLFKDLLKCV